jgi:predicted acetyltransferase
MTITLDEVRADNVHVLMNLFTFFRYELMPWIGSGPGSELNRHGTLDGETSRTHEEAARDIRFWIEKPGVLHPFLIQAEGRLVGFATVASPPHAHPSVDFRLNDFFVVAKCRRRCIGRRAAFQLFERFAGRWEIGWLAENAAAGAFWREVVRDLTDGQVEDWPVDSLPGVRFTARNSRSRQDGKRDQ